MQIKNILSVTVIVIFSMVTLLSQNVYAFTSITSVTWNDVIVDRFGQVVPSEDEPLEFFFLSSDENNNDLPANFQCVIYRVNDDANQNNDDIQNGIDIDDDGTADLDRSDITQIAADNCGTNTASSDISYTALSQGFYIFEVTATPLSSGEQIDSAVFPFNVPPFQAASTVAGGTVLEDVKDFWRNCPTTQQDSGGEDFELQSIDYVIKGESKIEKLHIKDHKLKLKILTNTNNNELKAKLSSGDTDEDFRIHYVDTVCNYEGPPYAGGPETAAPRIGLDAETFEAWNPPLFDCANTEYLRELEYPFKVESGLSDLKNADTKNIKIEMTVDRTPNEDTAEVTAEMFLGKDSDDKDIEFVIQPEKGPEVECKGKTIIS
ncbi:MAG: hypothetical protein ACM3XP_05765 [Nitrososphaerales archaeon]